MDISLDPWDLRHLLLSLEDTPRDGRDGDDLDAVVTRAVARLAPMHERDEAFGVALLAMTRAWRKFHPERGEWHTWARIWAKGSAPPRSAAAGCSVGISTASPKG